MRHYLISVPVIGLVTGLLALLLLSRLAWLGRAVGHVADTGDLSARVHVRGKDEVSILAGEINAMLERLESTERDRMQVEAALSRHASELARSNADLEQFAYSASHDLQEPLRAVLGFSRMLERRYGGKLDEEGHDLISRTVNAATRMQALINDLLAYSRVGRDTDDVKPVDCEAVVDQQIDNMRAAVEESGALVTHDPLPTVPGDHSLLGQAFGNLIGNGIKFRGEESPRVHVGAQLNGDKWVFSVRDNGIGLDPKYADRIFAVFQRLHTREEYQGTGIGLAVCKKAVERLGGRLWVESRPGEGATFFFTVPTKGGGGGGVLPQDAGPAENPPVEAGSP
jgi:light-regulated signal transduction histidine kinase (bacteriophytochrome)/HAMP domain-containing protein